MQFQKISIHTPWEVIGDSKRGEGLKSQLFRGKYKAKLIFPKGREWNIPPLPSGRGGGGVGRRYGYFLFGSVHQFVSFIVISLMCTQLCYKHNSC